MDGLKDKTGTGGASARRRPARSQRVWPILVCASLLAVWTPGDAERGSARAQISADDLLSKLRAVLDPKASPPSEGEKGDADPEAPETATPPTVSDTGTSEDDESADDAKGHPYIRVGVDDRITMHVSGLPLAEALRMLSEPSRSNIILAEGLTGMVSATFYDATFDAALRAMLVSNGLGYRVDGDFVFVHTLEQLATFEQAAREVGTRIFRLSYVTAAAVKDLIEPMVSSIGKITVTPPAKIGLGGEKGLEDTEGDNPTASDTVIVMDYVSRLDAIEDVIRQLDIRPQQVLIEATILRATLNEDNALGIDFTTVGGIDFTTLNSTSPGVQSIATGNVPVNLLGDTTMTARTEFSAGFPGGGFTFGVIKDQIGIFIRALEQVTDTDILANPKVLALNKQYGQVIVGRRDGYITTTITETTAVQTVEFLETGTILTFRPFIGNDGYVRMEIHPKDSTGGLTQANLPFEQTTEVTTNVLVKDGHTILIGGLFREVSTATRGQVPGLGNIPIAGALFRSTSDVTTREEVIILLTVRVIKGVEDTASSRELREDVERFRVGMRRGMQWIGRERLAQSHYGWALEHMAAGDIDRALWDVRIALHNYPRHVHAAKLLETLSGRRDWESEASSIRSYVRDRIMKDAGIETPDFGRPAAPPFVLPEFLDGPAGFKEADGDHVEGESS